jgi:purine-nucleoside phosphorylase
MKKLFLFSNRRSACFALLQLLFRMKNRNHLGKAGNLTLCKQRLSSTRFIDRAELNRPKETINFQEDNEFCVKQAADYLRKAMKGFKAEWALTLGSGLGGLAEKIKIKGKVKYEEIPFFPKSTVKGHEGTLYWGELEGVPVIGLKGRKHYYEVADLSGREGILQVVFPVNVLAELGVKNYFATNAAGGINPNYKVGDLVTVRSHIKNGDIPSPLAGRWLELKKVDGNEMEQFVPMDNAYDPELRERLKKSGVSLEGVYLASCGPCYETEAEIKAYRSWGVDLVGMSTVPEVIMARARGMRCVGMSLVTNVISAEGVNKTNHQEVLEVLNSVLVKEKVEEAVKRFFREMKGKD